jgi:arylsulfatase A-like enzyme
MATDRAGAKSRNLLRVVKVGLGYGLALGAVETLIMLAGHGSQAPAGTRTVIYATTLAADVVAALALALAFYGTALVAGKVIPPVRQRAAAVAEIGLVSVILAFNAVLIVRSKVVFGLPLTHPYKLAAFAACGLAALAVAAGWRALRGVIARKPVLISAAAAYVAASAVIFVVPELKWAARPRAIGPDVIFVSLDTVRADHLGCYGYRRDTSPNIDRFAREAVLFENAICVQPTTNPSHVSMFTGLYPAEHGVVSNFVPLRSKAATLAELLGAYGYETVGITGGFILDRRISNLARGFRYYDDYINPWSHFRHTLLYRSAVAADDKLYGTLRQAPTVTASALRILGRRRNRPVFLFVHYFDPHSPYHYRGAAERFYDGPEPLDFEKRQLELKRRWNKYADGTPRPECTAAVEALYDDEILYADLAVGRLLDELRRSGTYDRTLAVVTSDHGESFGEHEYKFHGKTVYDTETRVCLLVKPVGGGSGERVRGQTETLCLAYTVLAAAGAPTDRYRGKRIDLLAVSENPAAAAAWGFSQTNDKTTLPDGLTVSREYCLRSADMKLIFNVETQRYEYYDLTTDPAENRNLSGRVDDPAYESYRDELTSHIEKAAFAISGRVDGDLADALRSLGYTN